MSVSGDLTSFDEFDLSTAAYARQITEGTKHDQKPVCILLTGE